MTVSKVGRLLIPFVLTLNIACAQDGYKIPKVTIQAFKPKGLRATLPDASSKLALFVFQGNVNRAIGSQDVGTLSGEIIAPTNGKWVYENPDVILKVGDVINYHVFASVDGSGYLADNLSYTITALEDPSSLPTGGEIICRPTLTTVRSGKACGGEIIFEENFDTLREDVWQIEQYIPIDHPEVPFVSYQHLPADSTVSVENGILRIAPKLQQQLPGFNNDSIFLESLNLYDGCTGQSGTCFLQAQDARILPPVVTGRLVSKPGFAFTYGTVSVRAKLPKGDWLYPEILLEPFVRKFGYGNMNFASGVLKIACARGNVATNIGPTEYGNKVLYAGPILDANCRSALLKNKMRTEGSWGDDFHVYSLRWAPERITLLVDGEEYGRIEPAASGLRGRLPQNCRHPELPSSGLAPFDDHFYLTLGLAAGGITEFPDGLYTQNGRPKPWRNQENKASLRFWESLDDWFPTWNRAELLVDYVKIIAL